MILNVFLFFLAFYLLGCAPHSNELSMKVPENIVDKIDSLRRAYPIGYVCIVDKSDSIRDFVIYFPVEYQGYIRSVLNKYTELSYVDISSSIRLPVVPFDSVKSLTRYVEDVNGNERKKSISIILTEAYILRFDLEKREVLFDFSGSVLFKPKETPNTQK